MKNTKKATTLKITKAQKVFVEFLRNNLIPEFKACGDPIHEDFEISAYVIENGVLPTTIAWKTIKGFMYYIQNSPELYRTGAYSVKHVKKSKMFMKRVIKKLNLLKR